MSAIFAQTLHIFRIFASKTFHNFNFSLWLSMAKRGSSFRALGTKTDEQVKSAKDKIRFDL